MFNGIIQTIFVVFSMPASRECTGMLSSENDDFKEALTIRCIFSLVDMITKAEFSNSPNDLKIHLFG